MLQLVYVSTATSLMDHADIEAICEQGRRNNHRDEITGVLVENAGRFLQVLEGPKELTEDAFIRIIVDSRHNNLNLLHRRITIGRDFGSWDMQHCCSIGEFETLMTRVASLIIDAPVCAKIAFNEFLACKPPSLSRHTASIGRSNIAQS